MNDKFVQVPHWLMDFLMTADLNMTQYRIVNAIIRRTYGFHKPWNQLSLSFLSELTKCNKRQVTRELKALLDQKIVLERMENTVRLLRINPQLAHVTGGNVTVTDNIGSDSLDTICSDSLDTRSSDYPDTHINKDLNKKNKEKYYIDLPIDETFLTIYNHYFRNKFNADHMQVTEEQLASIVEQVESIKSYDITEEQWEEAVAEHFNKLPKRNNGNILPFLKASFRYFEVGGPYS